MYVQAKIYGGIKGYKLGPWWWPRWFPDKWVNCEGSLRFTMDIIIPQGESPLREEIENLKVDSIDESILSEPIIRLALDPLRRIIYETTT